MEVLEKVGTRAKEKWLKAVAVMARSVAYAHDRAECAHRMPRTSPRAPELDGDEWVINGEKFYISGPAIRAARS